MKNSLLLAACLAAAFVAPTLLPAAPVVSNVTASQRSTGNRAVDISYDVSGGSGLMTVSLLVSNDNGATYTITPRSQYLTGNVGPGIANGTGYSIVWDAVADVPEIYWPQTRVRVTATESTVLAVPSLGCVTLNGGDCAVGQTCGGTCGLTVAWGSIPGAVSYEVAHTGFRLGGCTSYDPNDPFVDDPQTTIVTTPDTTFTLSNFFSDFGAPICASFRVRAVDATGNRSAWSPRADGLFYNPGLPTPPPPTGLFIESNVTSPVHQSASQTLTFTFSAPVSGFDPSDITVTGAAKGAFSGSGSVYTLDVTGTGGTVTASVDQHVVSPGNMSATFSNFYQDTWTVNLPGDVPMELIRIPAGTFTMGSPEDEEGRGGHDETLHEVTLTSDFYLSKTEVTQSQWESVLPIPNAQSFVGGTMPIHNVSWADAATWASALDAAILDEATFQLPTEAQWEYACRAATTSPYNFGDSSAADANMWYNGNSGDGTKSVGTKSPNPWGLFDMHGNVYEWCGDFLDSYPTSPVEDPTGPATGVYRVIRGGSWGHSLANCRSAHRHEGAETGWNAYIGFRIAATRSGLATPVISTEPASLTARATATISYNPTGRPLAGSSAVNIWWSYNDWSQPAAQDAMTWNAGLGVWQATLHVPGEAQGAQGLSCVFNNGASTWDNNGGEDFFLPVTGRVPYPTDAVGTPTRWGMAVVDYYIPGSHTWRNPQYLLDAHTRTAPPSTPWSLSMGGPGGYVVVDMGADGAIVNGPGNDLRVWELANMLPGAVPSTAAQQYYDLYVAADEASGFELCVNASATTEADLEDAGLAEARYVMLRDLDTLDLTNATTAGSDIDAIELFHRGEPAAPSDVQVTRNPSNFLLSWNDPAPSGVLEYAIYGTHVPGAHSHIPLSTVAPGTNQLVLNYATAFPSVDYVVTKVTSAGESPFSASATVNTPPTQEVSLDASNWTTSACDPAVSTLSNPQSGILRATLTGTTQIGRAITSQSFVLSPRTQAMEVRMEWMIQSPPAYCLIEPLNIMNIIGQDCLRVAMVHKMSTNNSWQGSTVVSSGTWYYSMIRIEPDGSGVATTASGNYLDQGGTLVTNTPLSVSDHEDALTNARILLGFGDNHAAPVHVDIRRLTVGPAGLSMEPTKWQAGCNGEGFSLLSPEPGTLRIQAAGAAHRGGFATTVDTFVYAPRTRTVGARIEWKINSPSTYTEIHPLVIKGANCGRAGGPIPYNFLTTNNTFMGSSLVQSGVWYYSTISIDPQGNGWARTASGNYPDQGGTLVEERAFTVTATDDADLAEARLEIGFTDNYSSSTYMDVRSVSVD